MKANRMNKTMKYLSLFALIFFVSTSHAYAAGETIAPPKQHWSFNGLFGTYDKAQLQRGFQAYKQVCSACHAMKQLKYRNLAELGYSEAQVKSVAGEYSVQDGPNDEGEYFERPAIPADAFVSPFPNEQAARYANNGAYPVDMSLIAKARYSGSDYIYALLTGYKEPPEGETLRSGQYWNKYYPGHKISMAPPLSDGIIAYADGSPETVSQYAKDISAFLTWAAEPELVTRKQMGIKVLIFLIIFAGIMYGVKKKIWADLH